MGSTGGSNDDVGRLILCGSRVPYQIQVFPEETKSLKTCNSTYIILLDFQQPRQPKKKQKKTGREWMKRGVKNQILDASKGFKYLLADEGTRKNALNFSELYIWLSQVLTRPYRLRVGFLVTL